MAKIINRVLTINPNSITPATSKNLKTAEVSFNVVPENSRERTLSGMVYLLVRYSNRRSLADAIFQLPFNATANAVDRSTNVTLTFSISNLVGRIAGSTRLLNNATFYGFISTNPISDGGVFMSENPTNTVSVPIIP